MFDLDLDIILLKSRIETILERYGCSIKVLNFDTMELDIYCPDNICIEEKSKILEEALCLLESYSESENNCFLEEDDDDCF